MAEGSDTQATDEGVVEWIVHRKRGLTIGAASLAAIAVVAWFMVTSAQRKEAFAAQALDGARQASEAGNLPLAATELQRVVDTYRGTTAALEATLSLNVVRMASGQDQLAADGLQAFLEKNPPKEVASRANLLLGGALENLGRPAEAAAAYEKAAELAPMDFAKADALLQAARAYSTSGDTGRAAAVLRSIIQDFPETAAVVEAEVRLGEMGGSV